MPASSAQRSSSSAMRAAAAERGVGDGERLGLGAAAEVLLDLVLAEGLAGEVADTSWETAAESARRSWPTACTRAAAAPGRSGRRRRAPRTRRTRGSRSPAARRLRLGHASPACAAWSAPRCPSGRRRGPAPAPRRAPARRRSRAGRRRTPRAGPRGRVRRRTGWPRTGRGPSSRPAWPAVRSSARVSESSASASWPRTAARTGLDRPLAQELLLARHEGDPAEHVGCARTCHGGRPYRVVATAISPSSATTARSPSRSVRSTSTPAPVERRRASRAPGGRSRCRRPPRPARPGAEPEQPVGSWNRLPWWGTLTTSTASPGQARSSASLARRLDVAGEQHPYAPRPRPAARRSRRWGCRHAWPGRRPQHLERDVADDPGRAVRRLAVGLDLPTCRPAATPASAVDVVGVGMGQHQQRHPFDAQPVEAAGRRAAGPVRRPRRRRAARPGPQRQRVALADVAGDEHPPGRRPPGDGSRTSTSTATRQPQPRPVRRAAAAAAAATTVRTTTSTVSSDQRPRAGPPPDGRRAAARTALGDLDQPARRTSRPAVPSSRPSRVGDQTGQPAREPQHGGRPDDRRRGEVGGDRDQADLARDGRHERGARQLRRERYGDRLGRPTGAATARARRAARARASRMPAVATTESAKPTVSASARVEQQQRHDRDPERPRTAAAAVDAHPDQAPPSPIAAARTTLGSVRASSTKPTMPSAPTT